MADDESGPIVFRVPPRPPFFVGREEELKELTRRFVFTNQNITTLWGMAGVGKSTLALEWVYRTVATYPHRFDVVIWVDAADVDAVNNELSGLGMSLGMKRLLSAAKQARSVLGRLSHHRGVLVVYDGARNFGALTHLIGGGPYYRAIFTTRDGTFPDDTELQVSCLKPSESLKLLQAVYAEEHDEAAAQLCAELGHHPLAVAQVTLYAAAKGWSLRQVLAEISRDGARAGALKSVMAVLDAVYTSLDEANRRALVHLATAPDDKLPDELDTCQLFRHGLVAYPRVGVRVLHPLAMLYVKDRVRS